MTYSVAQFEIGFGVGYYRPSGGGAMPHIPPLTFAEFRKL